MKLSSFESDLLSKKQSKENMCSETLAAAPDVSNSPVTLLGHSNSNEAVNIINCKWFINIFM